MITLLTLMYTQVPRFLKLYLTEESYFSGWIDVYKLDLQYVWYSTQWVRGLDILKFHLFVLHNTDTISFTLFSSRFLRYNCLFRLHVLLDWSTLSLSGNKTHTQGDGRKLMGVWLRDKTISWKTHRRILETDEGIFPWEDRLQKLGKHADGIFGLCKRRLEMGLKLLVGTPSHGTTGHLQSSVRRPQDPSTTGVHNVCFQQVQDDMSKAWICLEGDRDLAGKIRVRALYSTHSWYPTGVVSAEDTTEIWESATAGL